MGQECLFVGWPCCEARPGSEVWQGVQHRAGHLGSVSRALGQDTPAHAEGKGALSLQSWASSAVSLLLLLPFLPSPERDPSSTNCHTVKLLSPLLQLGSAAEGMDYFQQSISIWEHISFWCAGSWVLKPLTPRWLPVLLNSVLMQPLPLQPFWTSVSSSRSLLVLMFCVFAISSFVPLLWLSFPI